MDQIWHLVRSASSASTLSGTPYLTSNGARQDSSAMLSGIAAASSTTFSNGACHSSATLSSTAACENIPTWISLSGDLAFCHQGENYDFKFPSFLKISSRDLTLFSI